MQLFELSCSTACLTLIFLMYCVAAGLNLMLYTLHCQAHLAALSLDSDLPGLLMQLSALYCPMEFLPLPSVLQPVDLLPAVCAATHMLVLLDSMQR